jgi:hypothetical protein
MVNNLNVAGLTVVTRTRDGELFVRKTSRVGDAFSD